MWGGMTAAQVMQLNSLAGKPSIVLWDTADANVFLAYDGADCSVYLYARNGLDGPLLVAAGGQPVPAGYAPVALFNGVLHCRSVICSCWSPSNDWMCTATQLATRTAAAHHSNCMGMWTPVLPANWQPWSSLHLAGWATACWMASCWTLTAHWLPAGRAPRGSSRTGARGWVSRVRTARLPPVSAAVRIPLASAACWLLEAASGPGSERQRSGQVWLPTPGTHQRCWVLHSNRCFFGWGLASNQALMLLPQPTQVALVHHPRLRRLQQALTLQRFDDAWSACQAMALPEAWAQLAEVALKQLDIALATGASLLGPGPGAAWAYQ